MITFILSLVVLILGYIFYSRFIEKYFGADDKIKTPALRLKDGVDFIPMPVWKMFTIEFLNIAGLGPIFGVILGAMYGPVAYLWIVFGCVFMGSVHDYFSGMLSVRNDGASISEVVGKYLGKGFQNFLRIFSLLLLIFVGVAFVTGPAGLLKELAGGKLFMWLCIIFTYYLIATLLPINKIIGRIYPFFGAALLVMAISIGGYMIFSVNLNLHELSFSDFHNMHSNPTKNILYPMMFIVISCGAISGFHSTQAPMMARCMKKESYGRQVFYGAMIAEGIVAIIWATAAINYFNNGNSGEGVLGLNAAMESHSYNPAWVVNEICNTWLGKIGAVFAILGVIACPITTGDTAFRSARLTVSDMFHYNQKKIKNRLIISIPIFVIGFILSQLKFSTIWKYLGLSNQILATIVLWTAAMYLAQKNKNHLLLSIPAMFMTTICTTYIMVAPVNNGGLSLPVSIGYPVGIILAFIAFVWFLYATKKNSLKKM